MELLQLKYFSHAAKTQNFSHTAQRFMVPTSCVSASIKKLEAEIGVKLFDRSSNKIKLNEYGRIFLSAIDKSEELIKKAKADIADLSQTTVGNISLLILTNRQRVTEAISLFKTQSPKISFSITHELHKNQSNINEYDLVVTDRNINTEHFNKEMWIHEEIFLAVHRDNPISSKSTVTLNDLGHEKYICMQKGSSLRDYIDRFFDIKKISADIVMECDDPKYIRKYLEMGLGSTFFPAVSWREEINDNIRLLKIDQGLYRDSFIYSNKAASNIVHTFSRMLAMN